MSAHYTRKIIVCFQQATEAVHICGLPPCGGCVINKPCRQNAGVFDNHARESCNLRHFRVKTQRCEQIAVEFCNSSTSTKGVGHENEKVHGTR